MSDEPAPEETPEQREQRLRTAEQQRHRYRFVAGEDKSSTATFGYECSCGEKATGEDGFYTERERDTAVGRHVERACRGAILRGDG